MDPMDTPSLASANIIELTSANIQQVMVEESPKRPVVIDFWADWCAPCKALMPVLEKLANEYNGQFLLAKLDTEAEPQLSAQFGVRNLPTVAIFKDGQPVDGFAGALPESEVRQILSKHLPNPWDALMEQAMAMIGEGDELGALPLLQSAYEQSEQGVEESLALAELLLRLKRLEDAEKVLQGIVFKDQDERYQALRSQLDLAQQASETPEILELQKQLAANPEDLATKHNLAVQLNQAGKQKDALELLFEVLRKDRNFNDGDSRKTFVEMIQALGVGDPLAAEYQRKLYTLLY